MGKLSMYLFFLFLPLFNFGEMAEKDPGKIVKIDFYTEVNLNDTGLSRDVFNLALKGLSKLDASGKIQNNSVITIADYSQSSKQKRLYVIDLKNKKLLYNTYVAHGRNTGDEYASSFSNIEGTHKSSLGFFVTEKPVVGPSTGYSLILYGVEKGINDNALKREIIMHAADYATEGFIKKNGRLGRSFGCPVLPPEVNKDVIETIKGGTCLFIYNPDKDYLSSSSLLK
jgi:hypothetical protein